MKRRLTFPDYLTGAPPKNQERVATYKIVVNIVRMNEFSRETQP